MKPPRFLAVFAAVIVIIVLILYWRNESESFLDIENQVPPQVSQASEAAAVDGKLMAAVAVNSADAPGEQAIVLPESLQGTQPPAGWRRVEGDRLVVTPALRQLFDHYLAALGEIPLDQVEALIAADLASLPPAAREEARAILDDYLGYKMALAGLEGAMPTPPLSVTEMRLHLDRLHSLRREQLGAAVSEAFFAVEESYEALALAHLAISQDPDAKPEEVRARLAAAEATLPEPIQEARDQTRKFTDYHQALEALREKGASAGEIRQLRERQFGAEGAQKLAELEQKREDWNQRFTAYRQARSELAQAGLAEVELERAVARLRQDYFSERELARVQALDQANIPAGGPR